MGAKESTEYRVLSAESLACLLLLSFLTMAFIGACSGVRDGTIRRIALLAPFEGRYREVGYNAYYAVKLAMQDHGNSGIELLAVDDGGSVQSATARARALARDPLVEVVIALGHSATQPETQAALGEKPMLIVGNWGTKPEATTVFMLSNPTLPDRLTTNPNMDELTGISLIESPIRGGDVLGLSQVPLLTRNTERITVISSASLPDATFNERYLGSAEFAPEPGLLATLTYDAAQIALEAAMSSDALSQITQADYDGINGRIRFADGYWADAPIHCYGYDENTLAPKDCVVEQR
jgi:hypothetical protein